MFFFFPYGTDAPIYYRPIITLVLIAVNVFVFVLGIVSAESGNPEQIRAYALIIGDGLHPAQWLTCNFLHAGIWHLIVNMIFLWSFGLIVEGKLGPLKTLLVYLGIGIVHGAVVQTLMLGHEVNYCLGASGAIFGLMSLCLVWSPENAIIGFLFAMFRFMIRCEPAYEVPLKVFVALYMAWQILMLCISGGELSSEFLHLIGAAVGLFVGIVMLRYGLVDCEHWDIFSVWAGHHRLTDAERKQIEEEKPANKQRKEEEIKKRKNLMLTGIQSAIQAGTPLPALGIARKMSQQFPDWFLPEQDLFVMIKLLLEQNEQSEAMTAMRDYLARYTSRAAMIRLKMAQFFVQQNKPNSALDVLAKIDTGTLDDRQRQFYQQLQDRIVVVKKQIESSESGTYDIAETD
jgi:membrane associated rhomboid family serine protease